MTKSGQPEIRPTAFQPKVKGIRVFLACLLAILSTTLSSRGSGAVRPLTPQELEDSQFLIVEYEYPCPQAIAGTIRQVSPLKVSAVVQCSSPVEDFIYNLDSEFVFPDPYPPHCPAKLDVLSKPDIATSEEETIEGTEVFDERNETNQFSEGTASQSDDVPEECLPAFVITVTPQNP